MSRVNHFEIEKARQEYWVKYYADRGVEYTPSNNFKFYPILYDLTIPDEGYITNPAVLFLLSEFECMKKNILSYNYAMDLWIAKCRRNGIKCTRQDVHDAYTYAYGYGCEYEFEYL